MSTPDDSLLAKLLETDTVRVWRERLTACYFEGAAKGELLAEIQAALLTLAPDLSQTRRTQFGGRLFQELCRLASRDLPPPASEPTPEPFLSGCELGREIVGAYPYPLAVAYRVLNKAVSPAAQFNCLLKTYESLIHFLATVTVSAYLRTDLTNSECNRHLLHYLLRDKWSMGMLYGLFRDTVKLVGDAQGQLPYRELPAYLFGKRAHGPTGNQVLESFVELRNDELGHSGDGADVYFASLVEPNRALLDGELARIRWLAHWELIRPVQIDEQGVVRTADLMNGADRWKKQPFELPLQPRDRDPETGDVRADRDALLLVAPDRRAYLPLFPLSRFVMDVQAAYFLNGAKWEGEPGTARLAKAKFIAYSQESPKLEENRGERAVNRLEQHVTRLQSSLPPEQQAAARPEHADTPADDPDFTLSAVILEQQSHLKTFVGREETLAEIATWLERQTDGRYLLLLGPPGQGKSALMAELARREAERGRCLLHMVKSHPQPRRFLPALISQAARLARTRFGAEKYVGDINDLRNAFVEALVALQRKNGRAVVVVDALDELDAEGGRVTFLPPALPEGVCVVLTCRPDIPLVLALRARLRGCLDEQPLTPLDAADFAKLLEKRLEAGAVTALRRIVDFDDLFKRLAGNPLFLHCFLDDIADRWEKAARSGKPLTFDAVQLPTTLEAVFRHVYDRIRENRDGASPMENGRIKGRLLQLLCVAREPLTLEQLSELLATEESTLLLEDCRDRVEEMSQWLLEVGRGRFKPWHQGLADYVRNEVLGTAGVRQTEAILCRWLETPAARGGLYALRQRVRHLLAAECGGDAAALLLELFFLERKTAAGLVFELVGDLSATAMRLSRDDHRRRWLELIEEAIRADIHFIAQHPSTLFQCLWNSCWWYDCDSAAKHYDVPEGTKGPLPWDKPRDTKLATLLETWRAAKETTTPGFVWLRSLRPPMVRLGAGQKGVFRGHEGEVNSVSYAPDGRRIVSASSDWTVRVWDADSGEQLHCLAHKYDAYSVSYSPDGRRIVSGARDSTIRVWDTDTGEQLHCLFGHEKAVLHVTHSPDSRHIVSGSCNPTIHVRDVENGNQLHFLHGHEGEVNGVSYSPDNRRIVSASSDMTLRVWDADTGEQLHCLHGHKYDVNSVSYSPDGQRIVSGAGDHTIRVWDASTGKQLHCLHGHVGGVNSVSCSPDGRRIVSGSSDMTLRVWDADTGEQLRCLLGHEEEVNSVSYSPDGQSIVSGASDKTIRVWDADRDEQLYRLRNHEDWVRSVSCSPDGRRIASASKDTTIRVWDIESGEQLHCFHGHENGVRSLSFSPDGRRIVSGASDMTLRVWDADSGEQLHCLRGHESWVRSVNYSPDGRRIVSGAGDHTIRVWDADSGEQLHCLHGHVDGVNSVSYSPDNRRIISASSDMTLRVWDADSGEQLYCLRGHEKVVLHATHSPDGRCIVGVFSDGTICMWDPDSEQLIQKIANPTPAQLTTLSKLGNTTSGYLFHRNGKFIRHPSGRFWVGWIRDYVCILAVEGE